MQIDLLYFDDCPSWKAALENLQIALQAEGREAEIRLIKVETDEEAADRRFLGSPSFQVNGSDLWLEERADYSLSCRIYPTPDGISGVPNVQMIRDKLRLMES